MASGGKTLLRSTSPQLANTRYGLWLWVMAAGGLVTHDLTESCDAQVSVRVMGGLMALGYKMKVVMKRSSIVFTNAIYTIKLDTLEGLDGVFVQVRPLSALSHPLKKTWRAKDDEETTETC